MVKITNYLITLLYRKWRFPRSCPIDNFTWSKTCASQETTPMTVDSLVSLPVPPPISLHFQKCFLKRTLLAQRVLHPGDLNSFPPLGSLPFQDFFKETSTDLKNYTSQKASSVTIQNVIFPPLSPLLSLPFQYNALKITLLAQRVLHPRRSQHSPLNVMTKWLFTSIPSPKSPLRLASLQGLNRNLSITDLVTEYQIKYWLPIWILVWLLITYSNTGSVTNVQILIPNQLLI